MVADFAISDRISKLSNCSALMRDSHIVLHRTESRFSEMSGTCLMVSSFRDFSLGIDESVAASWLTEGISVSISSTADILLSTNVEGLTLRKLWQLTPIQFPLIVKCVAFGHEPMTFATLSSVSWKGFGDFY
jgi:hypothetical protein